MKTSNELTTQANQELNIPANNNAIRPIVGHDLETAWKLANIIVKSGMAPKGLDTPEKVFVATQKGASVGLDPWQSMEVIGVINGKPGLHSDGPLALVRRSGKLEYIEEWIEGEGEKMVAHCKVKRKDEEKAVTSTFSVAQAKTAQLWGKQGPWTTYPQVMLQRKARNWVLDFLFAEELLGLKPLDEVQEIVEAEAKAPKNVTPKESAKPSIEEPFASPANEDDEPGLTLPPLDGEGSSIVVPRGNVVDYMKAKCEKISNTVEFEEYKVWAQSDYPRFKPFLDDYPEKAKELKDIYFAKQRQYGKPKTESGQG